MTKIGEGHDPFKGQSTENYQKELTVHTEKFRNALESFAITADSGEKERLKSIMGKEMELINAAVRELKQRGAAKQDVQVEKGYQAFIEDPSNINYTALEQDLSTLQEYGKK